MTHFNSIQGIIQFLSNVDITTLGFNSSLLNAEGNRSRANSSTSSKFKTRIPNVQLDKLVDSANSSLVSAVDSSFRLLSTFSKTLGPKTLEDAKVLLDGAKARGGAVLRRRTVGSDDYYNSELGSERRREPGGIRKEMIDFENGVPVETVRPSIGDRLASISGLSRSNSPLTVCSFDIHNLLFANFSLSRPKQNCQPSMDRLYQRQYLLRHCHLVEYSQNHLIHQFNDF